MRVLVTGATGFVGRHLLPVLEGRGHALTLAVRDKSAADGADKLAPSASRRVAVVGNIDRHTDWTDALQSVDAVIHLAARAHVLDDSANDEQVFVETNVRGTERLVEQSIEANVDRFVLMSSVGAVTSASDTCVTLDTACAPDTAYGRSKLAAEQALIEQSRGRGMQWTILRPTLVFGQGNPGNMERLIALVKRGVPLPLGAIHNRRSFTNVQNLVDLTAVVLSHPGARNAVFFVGDDEVLSTPELIRRITALACTRTRLVSLPGSVLHAMARAADAFASVMGTTLPFGTRTLHRLESSLYVDIEPLRTRLGWTPPIGIDEGLRCMLTTS